MHLIPAWLVHAYTASGAVISLLALISIEQEKFQQAFGWMVAAVAVDATDGTLARAARTKEKIPWFDGDRLEDIIDYLNYVLVPVVFILRARLLPPGDALWLASLPLLASAYGFCRKEAKTPDHFFLGFPSFWNIIAFYLYVLQTPRWVNAFTIIALSALVFVPIRYLYPSRSPIWRRSTNALGFLWGIAVLVIIAQLPDSQEGLIYVSLIFPAYYVILSLWLESRRA